MQERAIVFLKMKLILKKNLKVSFEMNFYSPLFIGEILTIKNIRNQKAISLYYKYTYNEKKRIFYSN